jgi:DNA-binding NarL/FixJ family response regulator
MSMSVMTSIRISDPPLDLTHESRRVSLSRKRVVVADDLLPVRKAVEALLQPSFDVIGMASDGRAALEMTLRLVPDLVVLDVTMPAMSGIQVAEELRRQGSKAKIVFLTVHEDADVLTACQAAGGLGYVVKLFMDTDLIAAMNDALTDHLFVSRFSARYGPTNNP